MAADESCNRRGLSSSTCSDFCPAWGLSRLEQGQHCHLAAFQLGGLSSLFTRMVAPSNAHSYELPPLHCPWIPIPNCHTKPSTQFGSVPGSASQNFCLVPDLHYGAPRGQALVPYTSRLQKRILGKMLLSFYHYPSSASVQGQRITKSKPELWSNACSLTMKCQWAFIGPEFWFAFNYSSTLNARWRWRAIRFQQHLGYFSKAQAARFSYTITRRRILNVGLRCKFHHCIPQTGPDSGVAIQYCLVFWSMRVSLPWRHQWLSKNEDLWYIELPSQLYVIGSLHCQYQPWPTIELLFSSSFFLPSFPSCHSAYSWNNRGKDPEMDVASKGHVAQDRESK